MSGLRHGWEVINLRTQYRRRVQVAGLRDASASLTKYFGLRHCVKSHALVADSTAFHPSRNFLSGHLAQIRAQRSYRSGSLESMLIAWV